MAVRDYIRERFFPHIWCPGCGHGIVLNCLLRAVDQLGMSKNELVMVSGIGCSSRISGYVDFHTLHTLHGRALAFASGVKLSKPELNVIVPMGDGDALAIGGNHFIHAARRNIALTAIVMNNRIYGMTGGQFSPLSRRGDIATTSPLGNIGTDFDVVDLARAAGASFVARCTTYHAAEMIEIIKAAVLHDGFSVVEVLSQCPTYYGRRNKLGSAPEMMKWFKDNTVRVGSRAKQENPAHLERGIFVRDEDKPEYCREYESVIARATEGRY